LPLPSATIRALGVDSRTLVGDACVSSRKPPSCVVATPPQPNSPGRLPTPSYGWQKQTRSACPAIGPMVACSSTVQERGSWRFFNLLPFFRSFRPDIYPVLGLDRPLDPSKDEVWNANLFSSPMQRQEIDDPILECFCGDCRTPLGGTRLPSRTTPSQPGTGKLEVMTTREGSIISESCIDSVCNLSTL
jgi:hypothetical protein